jgi:hypothetical protein
LRERQNDELERYRAFGAFGKGDYASIEEGEDGDGDEETETEKQPGGGRLKL